MCWVPLAQRGRAGAGVGRLEHVAVVGQGVGAPHRRLPHAEQVLAGRQGQGGVRGAEISLRGKASEEGAVAGWEEEQCSETLATAVAIGMAG